MAKNASSLTSLPALPRSGRRAKPIVACACGCGMGTRSTWFPGHDGRATGWAIRVERGLMAVSEVPANERAGALIMLKRRADAAKAAQAEATEADDEATGTDGK